jgi:hypothetical protein
MHVIRREEHLTASPPWPPTASSSSEEVLGGVKQGNKKREREREGERGRGGGKTRRVLRREGARSKTYPIQDSNPCIRRYQQVVLLRWET